MHHPNVQGQQHSPWHNRIHACNNSRRSRVKNIKTWHMHNVASFLKNKPCFQECINRSRLLPQAICFLYPGIKDVHLPPQTINFLPPQAIKNGNAWVLPQAIRFWNAATATQKQASPAAVKKIVCGSKIWAVFTATSEVRANLSLETSKGFHPDLAVGAKIKFHNVWHTHPGGPSAATNLAKSWRQHFLILVARAFLELGWQGWRIGFCCWGEPVTPPGMQVPDPYPPLPSPSLPFPPYYLLSLSQSLFPSLSRSLSQSLSLSLSLSLSSRSRSLSLSRSLSRSRCRSLSRSRSLSLSLSLFVFFSFSISFSLFLSVSLCFSLFRFCFLSCA